MECFRCKEHNPEDKKYCGECGFPLDPNTSALLDVLNSNLRKEIQNAIADRIKEQKLVEIETAHAIVAKLSNWAKLFGFFAGIPLAILLIILAILGIKTYTDFSKKVENATIVVSQKLSEADNRAEEMKKTAEKLEEKYKKLGKHLTKVQDMAEGLELENLETRVK